MFDGRRSQSSRRCKDSPIKLLIGSEFNLLDDIKLVLLAKNRKGYGAICHLISIGRRRASKGEYELRLDDVTNTDDDVAVIWLPDIHALDNQWAMAKRLNRHFGRHLYIGSELGVDGLDHIKGRHCSMVSCRFTNGPLLPAVTFTCITEVASPYSMYCMPSGWAFLYLLQVDICIKTVNGT